jgi:glycine cleavage system transcriptional repressor
VSMMLISAFCPDRAGLVAAITGRLFDLGGNLGDTNFAVLGSGAEFTSVCEMPDAVSLAEVESDLKSLPALKDGTLSVRAFELSPVHGPQGKVTHRVTVSGADRPGLIARLSEVFGDYGANIVTLNAEHVPDGAKARYIIRFEVWIPEHEIEACLATIANTSAQLAQSSHWESV